MHHQEGHVAPHSSRSGLAGAVALMLATDPKMAEIALRNIGRRVKVRIVKRIQGRCSSARGYREPQAPTFFLMLSLCLTSLQLLISFFTLVRGARQALVISSFPIFPRIRKLSNARYLKLARKASDFFTSAPSSLMGAGASAWPQAARLCKAVGKLLGHLSSRKAGIVRRLFQKPCLRRRESCSLSQDLTRAVDPLLC